MTDKQKHRKNEQVNQPKNVVEENLQEQSSNTDIVAELQTQLDEALRKSQEYMEGLQRERADFINYKRRIEREQVVLSQSITAQIVKKYLAVSDDMERALKIRPKSGEGANWAEGVELIQRKLLNVLDSEGLQKIPADGQFDPTRHEAISHEEISDHESGQIIEVVQQGYMIGDRVIRPALVRVAR